jgi:hypothetical protein
MNKKEIHVKSDMRTAMIKFLEPLKFSEFEGESLAV